RCRLVHTAGQAARATGEDRRTGRRPVRLPVRPLEPGRAAARRGCGLPGGVPALRPAPGRPAAAPDRPSRAHPAVMGRSDAARADLADSPGRVTAARLRRTARRDVTQSEQPFVALTC